MNLRDYQSAMVDAIYNEWLEHTSTIVVAPTGTGKTILFAAVIERMQPKRSLVIAHREELIWQAREKIRSLTGLESGIEMADLSMAPSLFGEMPVVISTVQTQNAPLGMRKRMSRFNPDDFGLLVIDECFVAGTLIDGRPIETIRRFQEITTHIGTGRVTHVFRRRAEILCRLRFSDGRELVCTLNHPIWTPVGYVCAAALTIGDMVLTITPYEEMRNLRKRSQKQTVSETGVSFRNDATKDCENISKARRADNQVQKDERNAQARSQGVGVVEASCNGMETNDKAWERTSPNTPATSVGSRARMANGSSDSNQETEGQWLSDLLQGGHWRIEPEGRGGGGWQLSRCCVAPDSGQQERRIAAFTRLVSREILEPGSGCEFARLCPDGFVYNLEVSNGNTYCANGVLVHNCHHGTADSYKNLINYYTQNKALKVLGVTATPDRTDEEALGQIFESVAFDYEILDAIHDGWLVPVDQQFVHIEGLDFSEMRTTAGDLNGADLAAVMEAERNLQEVTGATISIIGNRRAIVFTASVKQAETTCNIFNRHRSGMAEWVYAGTPKDNRKELLSKFQQGDTQVICNCGILTEGFDDPGVEVIVMARPTKSRSLYAQMAGRSTRPLPGIVDGLATADERKTAIFESAKKSCLIVDFVGNSGRHKLMSSADILGGKVSDAALERAVERAKKLGKPVRMSEALDEAEEQIQELAEQRRKYDELRKARVVAKVSYTTRFVNPFDALDLSPVKERGWDSGRTLSEKQRALLLKQGIDPDSLPYAQARQVIGELFKRWNNGWCSIKQAQVLKRYGYETKELSRDKASALLDALAKNRWKKPVEVPAPDSVPF